MAATVDHHPIEPRAAAHGDVGQQHAPVHRRIRMHAHLREQHAAEDRSRHDASAGDQRLDRHAAPVVPVVYKLRRRQLRLIGRDRPAPVVHVQHRIGGGQVDVRIPIRIDGAHIAPVRLGAFAVAHAAELERMRRRLAQFDRARNDVLAEVVAGRRIGQIAFQLVVQKARIENIDAHAGQRAAGLAGHLRRIVGLLHERSDVAVRIDRHHPERFGLIAIHFDAAHRALAAQRHMVGQHHRIVHLVDVIAGQHHHIVGAVVFQNVVILIHRIGRAAIPGLVILALLRGQQVDKLVHLRPQKGPAALQMAQQTVALVLGDHADPPDARIEAVGQREIDDPELAAEIHRRLGPHIGQALQPAAAPACKHQRDRPLGQLQTLGQFVRRHGDSL